MHKSLSWRRALSSAWLQQNCSRQSPAHLRRSQARADKPLKSDQRTSQQCVGLKGGCQGGFGANDVPG